MDNNVSVGKYVSRKYIVNPSSYVRLLRMSCESGNIDLFKTVFDKAIDTFDNHNDYNKTENKRIILEFIKESRAILNEFDGCAKKYDLFRMITRLFD